MLQLFHTNSSTSMTIDQLWFLTTAGQVSGFIVSNCKMYENKPGQMVLVRHHKSITPLKMRYDISFNNQRANIAGA